MCIPESEVCAVVKVANFSLQSDVYLPEDFSKRYASPWILYPNQELAIPERRREAFNNSLDQLELCSQLGFDGVGLNQHHSSLYSLSPCPNLYAAALARSTTDTAILILGNGVASQGNPVRLAEEYAFVDVLSGGRLVAGVPVGIQMDVNYANGIVPSMSRARYAEAMDLIMQAWTRPGPFPFNGRFYKLRYVNPDPLPMQKPYPPVWCLGTESIDTWEYVAEHDYAYGYVSFFGGQLAEFALDGFWDVIEAHDRGRNPNRLAFLQIVCVSETDAAAEADYAEHVFYLFDRLLSGVPRWLQDPPGYRSERMLKNKESSTSNAQAVRFAELFQQSRDTWIAPSASVTPSQRWKGIVDSGGVIAGSPATVTERLRAMASRFNIGHLMCFMNVGSLPHEAVQKNLTLFAEGVLPNLRDLHADWDDPWWPQGARQKVLSPATAAV
jgi:alkanesulfonate monooxygenase SsuD/methylene tetrahydromethanopterin reductase-like flavin-dependent oxidoreductase (luciferase family)